MIEMPITELCNADYDRKIKVTITVFARLIVHLAVIQFYMQYFVLLVLKCIQIMIALQIDCFDWDKDTEHDLIGSFETTLKELAPAKDREVGSIISFE